MSSTADELAAWLTEHPAPASDEETLALEPNSLENNPPEGPHEQINPNMYVHMTKPDGSEFLAPLANEEAYQAKGYTSGSAEEIEDLVAYWADKAATEAPKSEETAQSTEAG